MNDLTKAILRNVTIFWVWFLIANLIPFSWRPGFIILSLGTALTLFVTYLFRL
jgi:hypothetical protein